MVIWAPGMAAPDWSTTVPRIVPRKVCAFVVSKTAIMHRIESPNIHVHLIARFIGASSEVLRL
jgi:hypothetical protein